VFEKVSKVNMKLSSINEIIPLYPEVFSEGIGTVANSQASLALQPEAAPKFMSPRKIPFALKPAVEQEIRRLEAEGTWEKVNY